MKKWVQSMFSAKGDVSFKRVGSALALITCISIAYVGTFTIYDCPEFIYNGLLLLAGAGMGFTTVENILSKVKPNEQTEQ